MSIIQILLGGGASFPKSPISVSASALTDTTASVSWNAPSDDGGSPIISYTIVSNPGEVTKTVNQSTGGTTTITGLSPATSYTFTVYATNSVGNGPNSDPSNSMTTQLTPGEQTYTSSGTYTWIVPPGVTSISFVLIGGGAGGHMSFGGPGGSTKFGSNSLMATGGNGSSGGGGAPVNTENATFGRNSEGQGGIGVGGDANYTGGQGGQNGNAGHAATYTGNGTGYSSTASAFQTTFGGAGTNLSGGVNNIRNLGGDGTAYGGGGGSEKNPSYSGGGRLGAGGGGGLMYKNNYPVIPGSSITITVGGGGSGQFGGRGGSGAVRIVWPGNTRSFPSTNI